MKTFNPGTLVALAAAGVLSSAEIHAVAPSYTWSALVDSQPNAASATRSLRGIELSSDNTSVYATWIQDTGIVNSTPFRRVVQYDAVTGFELNSMTMPYAGNGQQAKSIATDDRGYVYVGSGDRSGEIPYIQSYDATLNAVSGKIITPLTYTTIFDKRVGGLAVQKSGSTYWLYTTRESGAGQFFIQRYDVTVPTLPVLDNTFNSGSSFFDLATLPGYSGAGFPRGLDVGVDGTLYVSSDDPTGAGATSGRLYRISPNLTTVSSAAVLGAFDVSLYAGELYVSSFRNGNGAGVEVLNAATLAPVVTLTGTGVFNRQNFDNDNGYSGIDVASDGRIFVADQLYDLNIKYDRLLVATPEPASAALLGLAGLGFFARRRRAVGGK